MPDYITTYEAAKIAKKDISYIRRLLSRGTIKGRHANITDNKAVWLVDPISLKKFLSSPRKTGPKPKNK